MGQLNFKKPFEFQNPKFQWNILLPRYETQQHKFGFFYIMSVHKNHFKKQKYGTESV